MVEYLFVFIFGVMVGMVILGVVTSAKVSRLNTCIEALKIHAGDEHGSTFAKKMDDSRLYACSGCGTIVGVSDKFCRHCGKKIIGVKED